VASWSHVQVLNPLPMLREARAKQAVYYANDEHLNPRGQQALAAFLVQQLNLR
jgi:dTDP-4-dehydrorhamnose reductase